MTNGPKWLVMHVTNDSSVVEVGQVRPALGVGVGGTGVGVGGTGVAVAVGGIGVGVAVGHDGAQGVGVGVKVAVGFGVCVGGLAASVTVFRGTNKPTKNKKAITPNRIRIVLWRRLFIISSLSF